MLLLGMGYAQSINEVGVLRVALWIGGSLVFGVICVFIYLDAKNNEHSYVDPSIDIQTLANYKKDNK